MEMLSKHVLESEQSQNIKISIRYIFKNKYEALTLGFPTNSIVN